MAKIRITNANRWFDTDAAVEFPGRRYRRGVWVQSEQLYYTRHADAECAGSWVLRAFDEQDASDEHKGVTCHLIPEESAIKWLIKHEYYDGCPKTDARKTELPANVAHAVWRAVAAAEV